MYVSDLHARRNLADADSPTVSPWKICTVGLLPVSGGGGSPTKKKRIRTVLDIKLVCFNSNLKEG